MTMMEVVGFYFVGFCCYMAGQPGGAVAQKVRTNTVI